MKELSSGKNRRPFECRRSLPSTEPRRLNAIERVSQSEAGKQVLGKSTCGSASMCPAGAAHRRAHPGPLNSRATSQGGEVSGVGMIDRLRDKLKGGRPTEPAITSGGLFGCHRSPGAR